MREFLDNILNGLNPEQLDAVKTTNGPLLVLSGAGTGKTRVLTSRIAYLIATGVARPFNCLALTFTNKAAGEMKSRLTQMLGGAAEGSFLGTFHSLGVKILRRHAELVGLKSNFTILNEDDTLRLVKQIYESENIDAKRYSPAYMLSIIQRWKDKALVPGDPGSSNLQGADFAGGKAPLVYTRYQDRLQALNAADFGDLILHPLRILAKYPEILTEYQERYKYIMIDEYQDTNVAQYLFLRLLANKYKNLCCVGDDDQSIYSWRGAEVENILRFEKDFPDAKVIRLERNYRSTGNILAAASALIANNEGRLGKTLYPAVEHEENEKIKVCGVVNEAEEAERVISSIENLHYSGKSYSQMAVLVRAGFQTRAFEEKLTREAIPYQIVGGQKFYERAEVKDVIAYVRILLQPADDLALERIINVPKRGLGDSTVNSLHQLARARDLPLFEVIPELLTFDELRGAARKSLGEFYELFAKWKKNLQTFTHEEVAEQIIDDTGYLRALKASKEPNAESRIENVRELLSTIASFASLDDFMEHVSLFMDNDEQAQGEKVSIMTLHAAKGLEFDYIFLPGWEEGLFPSGKSLDETGQKGLEEERRLAYVGLTRAKKAVNIYYTASRMVFGQWQNNIPSRFIAELPRAQVEMAQYSASAFIGNFASQRKYPPSGAYHSKGNVQKSPHEHKVSNVQVEDNFEFNQDPEYNPAKVGAKVFNQKFGYGYITHISGNSA